MSHRIELAGASLGSGLEYEPDSDNARIRLALLSVYTNDFSSGFGELTEVDDGTNVEVSGGNLKIKGSVAWDVNGVRSTALQPYATPGRFKIDLTPKTAASHIMIGFANAAALDYHDVAFRLYAQSVLLALQGTTGPQITATTLQNGTPYTFEFEWDADKTQRGYITGGVWTPRTRLFEVLCGRAGSEVGFQINCHAAFATQWEFANYERSAGFKTDDPVATLVDIDGNASGTWDASSISFNGDTSGLTIAYAYGAAANPSNWSSYLTLANLQNEAAWSGRHTRFRVKFGSDGDTPRTLTEGEIDFTPVAGGGKMAYGRRAAAVA